MDNGVSELGSCFIPGRRSTSNTGPVTEQELYETVYIKVSADREQII